MFRVIQFALALVICTMQTAGAADNSVFYRGVNIAGGEFTPDRLPGVYDRDYTYPDDQSIAYFAAKGMNTIRVPVLWERIQPRLGKALDGARDGAARRRYRSCRISRDARDPRRA